MYQKHKQSFIDEYEPEKWKLTLAEKLKYRRPGLINLFDLDTHLSKEVWVTTAFVKPGTHTFIVSDYRGTQKDKYHSNMHECTVDPREEEIVLY